MLRTVLRIKVKSVLQKCWCDFHEENCGKFCKNLEKICVNLKEDSSKLSRQNLRK